MSKNFRETLNRQLENDAEFRKEYEAHVVDKKCPAGVCTALVSYHITEKCIGCGMCAKSCPAACIKPIGEVVNAKTGRRRHVINKVDCIKCGACMATCPTKISAIIKR